ncbi:MAG: bifunctional nuclease family protein [Bacteroidaceae bacterium]|nr:bifunctional nuclease family protein [Bacteroidaceae bacterium]
MKKNEKIQLQLESITNIPNDLNNCKVTMRAVGTDDILSIVIGAYEGRAIYMGAKGIQQSRPMTHDLFAGVMNAMAVKLWRAVIYKVDKGVYYTYLYFQKDYGMMRVDARTSDALAMVVRMGAPIFTYKELLENALIGQDCFIRVEDDLDEFKELKVVTPGVDTLKQQLDEAIQKEDYEKAAELRDQLKQLGNE